MSMRKSRVRSEKLEVGMITAADVIAIVGTTIVTKGTVLDYYNIDKIRKSGVTAVIIEVDDELPQKRSFSSVEEVKNSPEFKEFKQNFDASKDEIKVHLDRIVRTDAEVNIEQMISEVDVVMSQACTGMEVFEMLNCMKNELGSVYQHSLNVSLMSGVIAKWAKLPKDEVDETIAAAILHDIGKLKVPYEILDNPDPSAEERRFLRKHAIYGYNILKNKVDDKIAQVALSHHERYDGSGYPMAQKSMEIPKLSRIIAIADIYDEATNRRTGNLRKNCPFHIIKSFEIDGFQKFDTEYLLAFLSGIADTYIGYKVMLSNGKTGTIVFSNKTRPSRPMVKVDNRYIDLGREPSVEIVEIL